MSNHQHDIQHEIVALQTSNRWATLGIVVVCILAIAGLTWAIDHYFGADGVRFWLIACGLLAVLGLLYLLSIGVSAVYGRMAMSHHDNVLQGLVAFQRADDYGEVARSVANNMGGVLRSGNSLDGRIATLANQLARQQTQALLTAERGTQRQIAADAERDWYNPAGAQFDDVPAGWDQADWSNQ